MNVLNRPRMTSDEFIAWAMARPKGERYELLRGEIVPMAAERVSHVRAKGLMYVRLREAIEAAALPCEIFPDGMAVEIDATTIFEPDAMVRCGVPLDGDVVKLSDPVIVVEVLSPSTQGIDAGAKLEGYFRLPSVRHYLIVDANDRLVVHHRRDGEAITTRIVRDGPLRLDPPGIEIAELWPTR